MKFYVQAILKDGRLGIASQSMVINDLKTLKGAINRVKKSVLLTQKNVIGFQITKLSYKDNEPILHKEFVN